MEECKISHITLIKMKLANVSPEMLKQVVEQLCKEHGGEMVTAIQDAYGKSQRVELGFKCHSMPWGVAFEVEKGEVQIKGDFWRHYDFQAQIQQELTQTYTAQAHVQSLRQMGYQVQTQKVGDKVLVRAFTY